MIAGIYAFNTSFLADLDNIQNQLGRTNQQISSGYRVNQASDDPSSVPSIIAYQGELTQVQQVQTNLTIAGAEASSADSALQSASSLLDQLTSLAASGSNGTTTSATRASIGAHVQQIAQQLVGIANTQVGGRYIFGGDASSTAPYTYNWSGTSAVVSNSTASATEVLRDADGNAISPRMTAAQIFDVQTNGSPAPGNIFQAVYSLGQALLTNNQAGIQNAAISLHDCVTQLAQVTAFYGNTENWISQAAQNATAKQTNITQALGAVRDTNLAAAATQLSLENVSLNAAISAHASANVKSLFDYLG